MKKVDIRWIAIAVFLIAIILRFLPHPPNFTPMASLALFAGCFVSSAAGWVLAFGAMAFSDVLGHWLQIPGMGFYSQQTMLTVYVALALTAFLGRQLRGHVSPFTVPLAAVGGTCIFFISTNFACWLDPIMGYAPTVSGLVECYTMALPFAFNSLLGDLFYSGVLFGGYSLLVHWSAKQETALAER